MVGHGRLVVISTVSGPVAVTVSMSSRMNGVGHGFPGWVPAQVGVQVVLHNLGGQLGAVVEGHALSEGDRERLVGRVPVRPTRPGTASACSLSRVVSVSYTARRIIVPAIDSCGLGQAPAAVALGVEAVGHRAASLRLDRVGQAGLPLADAGALLRLPRSRRRHRCRRHHCCRSPSCRRRLRPTAPRRGRARSDASTWWLAPRTPLASAVPSGLDETPCDPEMGGAIRTGVTRRNR